MKKSPSSTLHHISGDAQTKTTGMLSLTEDKLPLTEDKLADMSHTGQAVRSLSRISEFRESQPDISHPGQAVRSLSRISEFRESKPDIFGESWAITQQYKVTDAVVHCYCKANCYCETHCYCGAHCYLRGPLLLSFSLSMIWTVRINVDFPILLDGCESCTDVTKQ